MKKVNVRFETEDNKEDIDVLITASEKDEEVRTLIDRVSDPLSGTLTVYDADGRTLTLAEESIVSLSSSNKKVKILADEGEYELRMSMQDVEKILNPRAFIRISRYEIINLRKVEHFDFTVSGTLRIGMSGGRETWASRRSIPQIKERLKGRK